MILCVYILCAGVHAVFHTCGAEKGTLGVLFNYSYQVFEIQSQNSELCTLKVTFAVYKLFLNFLKEINKSLQRSFNEYSVSPTTS